VFRDHLPQIADCDWIIEAVPEVLDVKQALYRKIDALRRPGSAVSSNTSTIPLRLLTRGLSDSFTRDFLITHFFNPPRYMRLVEIITGTNTDPELAQRVCHFADHVLGKSIVRCKDSPGFIANRLGVYWLQVGVVEAIDAGLRLLRHQIEDRHGAVTGGEGSVKPQPFNFDEFLKDHYRRHSV